MKLFEFLIALSLMLMLFSFPSIRANHSLESAYKSLATHIRATQLAALSDDVVLTQLESARDLLKFYPSINALALMQQHHNAMWQIQFHLGRIYTTFSYSIYADTPRHAINTNFDSRPMAGDMILKNMDRKCLSAYNNTNTAQECKNNAQAEVRLGEYFGIEQIFLESDRFCKENGGGRIYFDRLGVPYCGKIPTPLQQPFKITLQKGKYTKSLCVMPKNGIIREC